MKVHLFLVLLCGAVLTAPAQNQPARVNRTLPKVSPPKTGLEFSANPTAQEISRARVFEEPLIPIGGEPSAEENAALAAALLGYAKRRGPDDFASLTSFLEKYPKSPWRAALLSGLGFEYYTTAHYSLALEAWSKALDRANDAKDAGGAVVLARAMEELALLNARLGRMTELEALLKSTGAQDAPGASEKINMAKEALWMMKNRPEVSFRCGPLALQSILRSDPKLRASCSTNAQVEIFNAASTQKGFSLPQVAELSKKVGLNYQMAFRLTPSERGSVTRSNPERANALRLTEARSADYIIPSVVHWKVGHYAAMVKQEGDRYLLEDPTFGNTVWATRQALEAETSGYFLLPPGNLPRGWRTVDAKEGASVWGKGVTGGNDGDVYSPDDLQTGGCPAFGMPVASIHLMTANLNIKDTPLAYTPPVGPPVRFTFRYNQRDIYATEGIFGGYYWNGFHNINVYSSVHDMPSREFFISRLTKMTHDWHAYLIDSPQSPQADVRYVIGGGGARTFKGFNTNSQTFAFQQYDQTLLKRTGPDSYELVWPDGSKKIFSQPDGSVGAGRRVYLTQIVDPAGNALTCTYDQDVRLVAVTDTIGQVTTLTYGDGTNLANRLLTRVTDPFGRFATFDYEKRTIGIQQGILEIIIISPDGTTSIEHRPETFPHEYYVLTNITDMLGLSSQPVVSDIGGEIPRMVTPYGTTSFSTFGGPPSTNNTRVAEITYPDGSRERVEYNQSGNLGIPNSDPAAAVPTGMLPSNEFLYARNTYYWSRTALASSGGFYAKAKIYHWLHAENQAITSGILESIKEPLEGRVWFNYPGHEQGIPPFNVGLSSRPTRIGRVLDDGTTQLYVNGYNGFGLLTNSVDPIGRTFSMHYASNGIDLLEVRQTRTGNNELLFRATYNGQHRPLAVVDAAGETNTFTYNARGQVLTATNPKGETTSYAYDADGYLLATDGALPGTNDVSTFTYDAFGRIRTRSEESGHTMVFDYDVMDRVTRITHPDGTFERFTYGFLDLIVYRDRAGRQTFFEYDSMRQVKKQTEHLSGQVTQFEWCRCGQMKSLTDPMGRTTSWLTDVQGRPIAKQNADGSRIQYRYENTTSRLRHVIDEKQQVSELIYERDNTVKSIEYLNSEIQTPGVRFTYDPNYERVVTMTDGTGVTRYSYNPITAAPTLGAGSLASVDGPLPNDTITYGYDEVGRPVYRAINGVGAVIGFDAAQRLIGATNVLGAFGYAYAGGSDRLVSKLLPNGQTETRSYGTSVQDFLLQRITHRMGATPISEFVYGHDVAADRIATWSQQAGAQSPSVHTFVYDTLNRLLSAVVTNGGALVNTFGYSYDPAGNRLTEQIGATNYTATYNALNQISTTTAPGSARTNEWDGVNRLVAINAGSRRTEFTYDGLSRVAAIRQLANGSEISRRQFVWCGFDLCEERDSAGVVTKRFFPEGVKLETGPTAGNYFYTRDHLGSIRELTDDSGTLRARYAYDPYGRRTRLTGDVEADFGFAGMFWCGEANLSLTHFRAYDAELGRWLSRDPLQNAELEEGPNLYAYVANDPVNLTDPLGLSVGDGIYRSYPTIPYSPPKPGGELMLRPKGELQVWWPPGKPATPTPPAPTPPPAPPPPTPPPPSPSPSRQPPPGQPPTRRPTPPARPTPPRIPARPPGLTGPLGVLGRLAQPIVTVLTIATFNCDTVEGILALVRQGNGGMANRHADKLFRELEKQKLL